MTIHILHSSMFPHSFLLNDKKKHIISHHKHHGERAKTGEGLLE